VPRSYQSIFDLPDPLTGSGSGWGEWASKQYSSALDWAPRDQYSYGYTNRAGTGYDPLPQGDPFGAYSTEFGFNVADAGIDAWLKREYPELYSGFDWGTSANPGAITSPGGEWAEVDKWDPQVRNAVQKVAQDTGVFVPMNLVKAIMRRESGGIWTDSDPGAGAIGVMQVMPFWADSLGLNLLDPAQNIEAGVRILAQFYNAGNPSNPDEKSWEWAARRYLGLGGADAYGTTNEAYWKDVSAYWNELQNGAATGGTAAAGTTNVSAIWGGIDAPITQEYGWTDFAINSDYAKEAYKYTSEYTRDGKPMGHMGIDVGLAYGTALYTPMAGTVTVAGGTSFYADYGPDGASERYGPGVGQLNITLDNGDVIVLGHMSQITVRAGDRVNPGAFVGYSGNENGAHLHLEYRKWVGQGVTGSGYEAQDPRLALQGMFTGAYGQAGRGPAQAASAAGDWNTFMMAAAKGLPLTGRAPGVGGFHDYLLQRMGLKAPTVEVGSAAPSSWTWQNPVPVSGGGGELTQ